MTRPSPLILAVLLLSAGAATAEGDPAATDDAAAGERAFRQCQSCHVVQDASGEVLAGRAARTGPNLYGVVGRTAGTWDDYRYSDLMVAAGEAGMVYDEATFAAYVMDPTGHLREVSGDSSGRSKMTFRVRKQEDAVDLYAFLSQFGE